VVRGATRRKTSGVAKSGEENNRKRGGNLGSGGEGMVKGKIKVVSRGSTIVSVYWVTRCYI